MRETRDVLRAIDAATESGRDVALATVVHIEGSTYRRPGARMLVAANGRRVGMVSGGCLEDEVGRMARKVMAEGRPRTARFDLTADDDALWGYGLGCNGLIELFLEPSEGVTELGRILRGVLDEARSGALVTVLDSDVTGVPAGQRMFIADDGRHMGALGSATEAAEASAAEAVLRRATLVRELTSERGRLRLFVEPFQPPIHLLIFGAGDDAVPLAGYAHELGWNVTVSDPRSSLLSTSRFPHARRLAAAAPEAMAEIDLGPNTAAVVMSHNFLRDVEYLRNLTGSQMFYIGLLGPRRRSARLLDFLAGGGDRLTAADFQKLHSPAGLDLGADGPHQIAWAILAEILAVRNNRPATPLRERSGPIHADLGAGSSDSYASAVTLASPKAIGDLTR